MGAPPSVPQAERASAVRPVELQAVGPSPAGVAQVDQSRSLLSAPAQEPDRPSPFYKRWPFWTAVGVAVAGGVTLGIVLSSRGHDLNMPSNTKEF